MSNAPSAITSVRLRNFGPFLDFEQPNLGAVNLYYGANGTGKTFLLKAIYAAVKSVEIYRRGVEPRSLNAILEDKLYWTFQVGDLGSLASKSGVGDLVFEMESDDGKLAFRIDRKTSAVAVLEQSCNPRVSNSTFFSPESVLPRYPAILSSREHNCLFGFDDPRYDLALASTYPISQSVSSERFSECRKILSEIIGGTVAFNASVGDWFFVDFDGNRYPISVAGETVCKLGALERLLGNRYIARGSALFFDEPTAGLALDASLRLWEVLRLLIKEGVQVFAATSSESTYRSMKEAFKKHNCIIATNCRRS